MSSNRKGSPSTSRESSPSRREAILDAALKCFLRDGFEATTIEDIRKASGASIGSIYHHFQDKRTLAMHLHERYLEASWSILFDALSSSRSPRRAIEKLVRRYLGWMEEEPDPFRFARFLSGSREMRAEIIDSSDEGIRDKRRWVEEWFQRNAEEGRIRKMSIDMYDVLVMGPIYEYAAHWLQGVALTDVDDAAGMIASAVWRSIGIR